MKKEKKSTGKKVNKAGGVSVNTISLLAFIAFMLLMSAALYFGQQYPLHQFNRQYARTVEVNEHLLVTKLQDQINQYRYALKGLAEAPQLKAVFNQQHAEAIAEHEAGLTKIFPHALRVRLLPASTSKPFTDNEPHFTYACLDLLNQSRKESSTLVEYHAIGEGQKHIDMMQVVKEGGVVKGYIQLTLDEKLLTDWLNTLADNAYIELQQIITGQPDVTIAKAGSGSNSGVNLVAEIPGTHWRAVIWKPTQIEGAFNLSLLLTLSVALLIAAVVVFLLRTVLHREMKNDLDKLLLLAANVLLRKQGTTDMKFSLVEFRQAAAQISNFQVSKTMERERDLGDGSSKNKVASAPTDPLFLDKNAISIEELDDTGSSGQSALDDLDSLGGSATAAPANMPDIPDEIFKAYDIRGIVGKTLTNENIYWIGLAIGSEAKARKLNSIAFARDGRNSGPELSQALIKGLQDSGMNVIDIGMMPTPVLYYAAAELAGGTGLMLTGSHNPADYNGIKMVLGGETLAGDQIKSLRQRILKGQLAKGSGEYSSQTVLSQYIERVAGDIKLNRKMKVVVDCGNGVAASVAPALLTQLGCKVTELYCEIDGSFPNHHPDPSKPENLGDLIAEVKKQGADLGLAFDGDGDRIGVVSGDGRIIWPDRLMMLYATDVLSRNPGGKIIFDIKCSSNLSKVIQERGGDPLMWKTGHSLIKAKMKESGALLAGEMSGHIFFKERWYGFDDALYASARLLEILSGELRQPRVVFSTLPDSINTPELNIEMQEGEHHAFMAELVKKQSAFSGATVSLIDGVRVDYPDGWGLVRASNTTPCLVLRFEGKDRAAMGKVQEVFRTVLTGIKSDINLPF